jgi:apolipoprotein N-acyltransferase
LFTGYAHVHTWLSGWAPILGVLGLSFMCAITAGTLAQWIWQRQKSNRLIFASIVVILFWCTGYGLQKIKWAQASPEPISIAMVQPNMAQENKWQAGFQQSTLDLLRTQTQPLWDHKIIIWPEAAIPLIYSDALPFLNEMNRTAASHHAGLITGIIFDDQTTERYYNSIATFGSAIGIYHKRRLVPFGEFVPLEYWLRGIINFLNLPTSIISFGAQQQHGLKIDNLFISPYVCYEIAYPDLVSNSAIDAQLLMSVSNLGWFGDSLGRHQFMEMAQMRALETQHYFAYSTNNGPSAIIDPSGKIQAQTTAFTQTTLSSIVYATNGSTPFMRWGSLPVIIFSIFLLLALYLWALKRDTNFNSTLKNQNMT